MTWPRAAAAFRPDSSAVMLRCAHDLHAAAVLRVWREALSQMGLCDEDYCLQTHSRDEATHVYLLAANEVANYIFRRIAESPGLQDRLHCYLLNA